MTDDTGNEWRNGYATTRKGDYLVNAAVTPQVQLSPDTGASMGSHPGSQQQKYTTAASQGLGDTAGVMNDYETGHYMAKTEAGLELICGPLLNYKWMSNAQPGPPIWFGSVLVVTRPGNYQPRLIAKRVGRVYNDIEHNSQLPSRAGHSDEGSSQDGYSTDGIKLYADPVGVFWRFDIESKIQEHEARWEYSIPNLHHPSGARSGLSSSYSFVVPAVSQSMRIMFHSCNGFSVGTDLDTWKGPELWNDVLRIHEQKPFHVMIGGGDQIYNDGVRVSGPLKAWTDINNPRKRRDFPFDESLRKESDRFYFDNYVKWFSSEPFATANARIPQVNIWDDHDIIDGFGSYTDRFMKCAVFRGIGSIAFKYYSLFQHHIPPPKLTFTTSSPQSIHFHGSEDAVVDAPQLENTFVLSDHKEDTCFILGKRSGPYIEERSRSVYMRLGARIAFLGLDARTERTRHQINYQDTYDLIFSRVQSELSAAKEIKHLIVLLGVPIAYPRLAWLENIFTSPIIGPIRFLNKRFGVAGGLFNSFDGQVDLLDDLDDHYTARQHKHERKALIVGLQQLAQANSVRITILGGDVHLAAVGRFYSSPKLAIPTEQDHRYMANVISSAITNKPPPKAVANLLARRNKIHHLNHDTHETLMKIFDRSPGGVSKAANWNLCTMPSRNYAVIAEAEAGGISSVNGNAQANEAPIPTAPAAKDGHSPLHKGEEGAGTEHVFASRMDTGPFAGGLDVSIRVEIDPQDLEGKTEGYGFSIPALSTPGSFKRAGA